MFNSESESFEMADKPTQLELATRESNGLHVQLLWDRSTDAVTVAVEDLRSADRFHLPVARERALDAFYHPFAYAA